MEHTRALHGQLPAQARKVRDTVKIVACGSMIGTAILFPLAYNEGLSFRTVTLSIFIITGLTFHALHLEPFVRFGPITAAIALLFLLVAVVSGGPASRKDLVPWLPLFIAASSLLTVAFHEVSKKLEPPPLSVTADNEIEFTGVSVDTASERSFQTESLGQPRNDLDFEPNRIDSLYFAHHDGPSSRYSRGSGSNGSEISLSSITGQAQPHWDNMTRTYFIEDMIQPPAVNSHQEQPLALRTTLREPESYSPDTDAHSEDDIPEPARPLLGPR
ncbi:hypothetical protein QBC35DRAFT_301595 [Podospora australis]|uniref:Uncharacterized protein n=1 Tax=Podospora australis TaxID=1536484 RepID=A0AAN6WP49_9PEZI|nr:hypothetical protein QBC35DRAFT_301595 [Podospora australis]